MDESVQGIQASELSERTTDETLGRKRRKKKEEETPTPEQTEGNDKSLDSEPNTLDKEELNRVKITLDFKKCSEILEDKTLKDRLKDDPQKAIFSLEVVSNEKTFKWDVYHDIPEIHTNIYKMKKSLNSFTVNEYDKLTPDQKEYFETILQWRDDQIIEEKEYICKAYEEFFLVKSITNLQLFTEFFNISNLSFNQINGTKPMEGYAEKKADPRCARKVFGYICPCFECCCFKQYNKRWIILKEEMIDYSQSSLVDVEKNVYFFDKDFRVSESPNDERLLSIQDASRTLNLRFGSVFEKYLWKQEINKRVEKQIKILKENEYGSFATPKIGNDVKWFSDGEDYYKDLYTSLMKAESTVFITDWWLSPEVFLVRPVNQADYENLQREGKKHPAQGPYSRLKDILYYLADQKEVKIYVMVYCEAEIALTLNSKHSKQSLIDHPNIQVVRHPHDIDVLLWSHHEKLVIIDQNVGYVGGLDLCWGRFDTHDHPLLEPPNPTRSYLFPGIDYSNARINDFTNVPEYLKENVNRTNTPRMPWHDVHIRIEGPVVPDIARHFVQRWNDAKFEKREGAISDVKSNSEASVKNLGGRKNEPKESGGGFGMKWLAGIINKTTKTEDKEKEQELIEQKPKEEKKEEEEIKTSKNPLFGGLGGLLSKQLQPSIMSEKNPSNEEEEKKEEEKTEVKKTTIPPYLQKQYKAFANYFKGKIFVDEDHAYKKEGNEEKPKEEPQDQPKPSFYQNLVKNMGQSAVRARFNWHTRNEEDFLSQTIHHRRRGRGNTAKAIVQVLRSSSKWSAGIKQTEHSILNGYYKLIDEAKHFIYIENQFFVSRSWKEDEAKGKNLSKVVENEIAYHIRKRIEKAIRNDEKFKVVVFIPLLPGFAGEPEASGTLQLIIKHSYAGIVNNKGFSIIEKTREVLKELGKNPDLVSDYINFYSLRNHAVVKQNNVDNPVTEIIYIHSKLMIVDDTHLLIGSANINDRSMLGSRDSEFAVIVKDNHDIESKMNGQKYKAAKFAATFRRALYAEHIGLPQDDERLIDPLSPEINNVLNERAKNNTEAYRTIFKCYPDDEFTTFKKLRDAKKPKGDELRKLYAENHEKIKGHVVYFPLRFLEGEIDNLGLSFFSAENLLPEKNYT